MNIRKTIQNILFEEYQRLKEVSQILKIIKSNKAYKILDFSKGSGTTWQEGGCWILADALAMYYELPIWCIYNDKFDHVDHFVVKINSQFIDSDGYQYAQQLIDKIAEDYSFRGSGKFDRNLLRVVEFEDGMNVGDIPRDLEASGRLVELFRK